MEVAPHYTLTLLTLLTLFTLLTQFTLLILFKLIYTAETVACTCMPRYVLLGKVRMLSEWADAQ